MTNSDSSSFDTGDLRRAEDAVAILNALADLLEEGAGSSNPAYVAQLRNDAAAVAALTSGHPDAQNLRGPHSAVVAVSEHRNNLRQLLQGLFR